MSDATIAMADQRGNRTLIRFARDAEDVASGLHSFRDNLPRAATRITAIISELFALSSVIREIVHARDDPKYAPSYYRIQNDLDLVLPTFQRTLDVAFDMFMRSRDRPYQMVWEDLGHRMENEEGVAFLERLEIYHDFLRAQFDVLTGYQPPDLRDFRRQLIDLYDSQEVSGLRASRRSIDNSGKFLV